MEDCQTSRYRSVHQYHYKNHTYELQMFASYGGTEVL